MQHLIIGAGPAGITVAETLRKLDPSAAIRVIGDEPEPPYSRMAIPYLLMDRITEEGTYLRTAAQHYSGQAIEIVRGRVSGVDAAARRVQLHTGDSLSFDRLLVATGSSPVRPPIPGLDLPGVHSCWTLEDARRIRRRATPGSRVALIGAGFIGSIILEALAIRGVRLSVIEQGEHMVPRMMSSKAGDLILRWCEAKGVHVLTGTGVTAIEQSGEALRIRLSDGEPLEADLVIVAAGVRANVDFLQGSGVKLDQGVLVDGHLRSSQPDIYAAGDVAQGPDFSTASRQVHAIQPTATEHGRVAAHNMAGQDVLYAGSINMNVLDTLGLLSCSFGLWMGVEGGEATELYQPNDYRFMSLQFRGERLVGVHAVGLSQHVGVLRGLIQRETPLGPWKERLLRDPTRIMEAYLATTRV